MAKSSNVGIEPAGYFSKEANEPAYKCKRVANAQMHKLAQTFAISSGDKGRTWKLQGFPVTIPVRLRFLSMMCPITLVNVTASEVTTTN